MISELHRRGRRLAWRLPAAAALLAVLIAAALGDGDEARAALGDPLDPPPPNIVLITTDDQPASTVIPEVMPSLHELLIERGSSFSDYIVTTPLCCPSRATMITGQYGHNNGVLRNDYANLIGKPNVLPVWLQEAGYNTAHIGKFLNGFGAHEGSQKAVAPGWDLWFTQFENKKYYNWKASKNGKVRFFREDDKDHLTDVTSRFARRWAKRLAKKPEPFYLQLDYFAPHGAAGREHSCVLAPVPAPRDEGRFSNAPLPRPPSYDEEDVSDKPAEIQGRPRIDAATEAQITERWRCTLASLRSVDRGIKRVVRKIDKQGELERTVFIFTSDNGYYFGEHRISRGKIEPYEENVRMPLTIVVPDAYLAGGTGSQPAEIDAPTANLDLAPTILELAEAEPCKAPGRCRTMDGRSLLPLLAGNEGSWPAERARLIELEDCQYRGVRVDGEVYFEYGRGPLETTGDCEPTDVEHYDLGADPYQLENLYPAPRRSPEAERQRDLQERMAELSDCAGIAGRDPRPPSGTYCE